MKWWCNKEEEEKEDDYDEEVGDEDDDDDDDVLTLCCICRECVECKHFKRGRLFEEKSCARICRDEIQKVEELGKNY